MIIDDIQVSCALVLITGPIRSPCEATQHHLVDCILILLIQYFFFLFEMNVRVWVSDLADAPTVAAICG